MKVIDLLNKIANDEKVPNVIKYQGSILAYDRQAQDYYCEEYGNLFEYLINERRTSEFLNNEVEIIEEEPRDIEVCGRWFTKTEYDKLAKEDKKIEKLSILTFSDLMDMEKEDLVDVIKAQRFKINEIIDYLMENKQ